MFVDEIKIYARAGRGGNGVVRWRHEKGKEFSGPSGGNGGKGGDVYAEAVRDLGLLSAYRNVKEFKAEDGSPGERDTKQGKSGEDKIIQFPIGSVIKNLETGRTVRLEEVGQKEILLHGGKGGLGNDHFKSSTNTTPREFTTGEDAEEAEFLIELELVADAGLIGLPNAGKSSLLNALTNAQAKIGSYQFTTLEPNLGVFYGFVLADIPGLIEGASEGKGLGHKFLKHIKRTKILLHCVSAEDDVVASYKVVRDELSGYGEGLSEKEEIVLLTKADLVSKEELQEKKEKLLELNPKCIEVSVLDDDLLKTLKTSLSQSLGE